MVTLLKQKILPRLEFIEAVCSEELLCLAIFLFFFFPFSYEMPYCHIAKQIFYSSGFLISVIAGVKEGARKAEIMKLSIWSWLWKAGGRVPITWRNGDDFLFNHSLFTLPHRLIFFTVGEASHDV